ncbi:MAG: hypothetical protein KU37_03155 [Sulfuricurvum sp. PC08-66]|nr:MAG: hypothetical protein KU37_03155 [Sulfuricurvum sp. PC08-66]
MLEELFEGSVKKSQAIERKIVLEAGRFLIVAPNGAGATSLLFNALHTLKPSTYLYIDWEDFRIDRARLIDELAPFCAKHAITTLAIDHYDPVLPLPNVPTLYLTSTRPLSLEGFETLMLWPLDFEEFLAIDSRYESIETAFSHFLQIGGFPQMIHVAQANRVRVLQNLLTVHHSALEIAILQYVAGQLGHKLSLFQLFERLKATMKLSKDFFYKTFYDLIETRMLLQLERYAHPKAPKKLYLIDFALKNALSFQKNFSKLFENLILLELLKSGHLCYYDEGIDFYLPDENRVVMAMPFANDTTLFALMQRIEGWLLAHEVSRVEVVTMSSEAQIQHPYVRVEMLPFSRWALIES